MAVSFKLDSAGLKRALEQKGSGIFHASKFSLEQSRLRLDRHMQTKRLRGRPGLFRRSGRLAMSFTGETTGEALGSLVMRYGTNVVYARIQEEGGVVVPRRAKWLTIPLPANLTPAGVQRQAIRSFKYVRFVRSKADRRNLVALCGSSAKDAKPMFVLVKKVTIPPRLGLMRAWAEERGRLVTDLNRSIRKALA